MDKTNVGQKPGQPQYSEPTIRGPKLFDAADVQKLIDDTLSKDQRWLEFHQKQVQADRDFFNRQFEHTKYFMTILVSVGFLFILYTGWSSASDAKIKAAETIDSAMRSQKISFDEQMRKSQESISVSIKAEAQKVSEVVRNRVNQEIEKPAIQATIDGSVQNVAKSKVQGLVSDQLNPIASRVTSFEALMVLNTLALRAQIGDRKAFEELKLAGRGQTDESSFARNSYAYIGDALGVAASFINRYSDPTVEALKKSKSVEDMKRVLLTHPQAETRIGAINLIREGDHDWGTKLVAALVQVTLEDPNLRVSAAAHMCLHDSVGIVNKNFEALDARFFDNDAIRQWWSKYSNRPEFQ